MKTPNAHTFDKSSYIVMADLPVGQQNLFGWWIVDGGQTQPVIDQEDERAYDCAYR